MKSILKKFPSLFFLSLAVLGFSLSGCAKSSGITLQVNPLLGSSQAARGLPVLDRLLGIPSATASIGSFNSFNLCLYEVEWETLSESSGGSSSGSSSENTLRPGLVSFNGSALAPLTLGNLDIADGTVLKNIKFTIATKPEVCSGADYSVLLNSSSSGGDRKVTQDVSFKFEFPAGGYTVERGQTVTLYLGDILGGIAALGSGLNNSSILGIYVGQAR